MYICNVYYLAKNSFKMLNIEQKYALRLEKYMCICTEKKENTEKELTDKQ